MRSRIRQIFVAYWQYQESFSMALQSMLFRGDAKLEAAAVSDPAHIKIGAVGTHVGKLQTALILLDSAEIAQDEVQATRYGASTALAVLRYKQKRQIINPTYQSAADDIVGKMTMASLDAEMFRREQTPLLPIEITPISNWRYQQKPHPMLASMLAFQGTNTPAKTPATVPGTPTPPHINPGPDAVLELRRGGIGHFAVTNGRGGTITVIDPDICQIAPVGGRLGIFFSIKTDNERFTVIAKHRLGVTLIFASANGFGASIFAAVKPFGGPPIFHPGVDHKHRPCRKWNAILHNPNNAGGDKMAKALDAICAGLAIAADAPIPLPHGPEILVVQARLILFAARPLASTHLEWYLSGKGKDFVEDDNIKDWVNSDSGIRHRLKRAIFAGKRITPEGHFFFGQGEYAKDGAAQDFRFAFGGIDRVDFEVDMADNLVRVWFQDRYEWHPFYPHLYPAKPGDGARDDNCVHAALVEMQDQGAADYWMKGVGQVPLSVIAGP
jgi:hypothetical protein